MSFSSRHHLRSLATAVAAVPLIVPTILVRAGDAPVSREEIIPTLRGILLDMHGGASALPRYAERLERERGFTRVQMEDLLLEIAADESWDGFARDNAVVEFIEIARPEELSRLDPFYISTNRSIRASIQSFLLEQLETVPEKLAYARTRLDWLAEHPEFQSDTTTISIGLRTVLHYGQPTDADRRLILDFFWNAATNAPFAESAYEADMLLLRDDPSWPTNEARRAMMEKWKDDPGMHEKTRALWVEALASFGKPTDADPTIVPVSGDSNLDEESPSDAAAIGTTSPETSASSETDTPQVPSSGNPAETHRFPRGIAFVVLALAAVLLAARRAGSRRGRAARNLSSGDIPRVAARRSTPEEQQTNTNNK